MPTRLGSLAVMLVGVLLLGAIQAKQFVGSLRSSDGECLVEREGDVVLALGTGGAAPKSAGVKPTWHVSAPYLRTPEGEFLAIEQGASAVTVRLAKERNDSAKWVIEVLSATKPEKPKRGSIDERQMLVGTASARFRLSVFGGPFKGWYVAADDSPQAHSASATETSIARRLTLAKDPRRAIVFHYVDTKYDILHK